MFPFSFLKLYCLPFALDKSRQWFVFTVRCFKKSPLALLVYTESLFSISFLLWEKKAKTEKVAAQLMHLMHKYRALYPTIREYIFYQALW